MRLTKNLNLKKVYSGIQPTGVPHLGNYVGAIKQWVDGSKVNAPENRGNQIFCVVDLHAMTQKYDPKSFKPSILTTTAALLASGLDPKNCILYRQSDVLEHAQLCWILNCICPISELNMMTQWKFKQEQHGEKLGLFTYPVLMAADILLFQPDTVPVGEDQLQHLQLMRMLTKRFNKNFANKKLRLELKSPEALVTSGARIKSLQNPSKKMSKSDTNKFSNITLMSSDKEIEKCIKKAVTDSVAGICYDVENRPGTANLLDIFSAVSGKSVAELCQEFETSSKGEFKSALTAELIKFISPIREEMIRLGNDTNYVEDVLFDGKVAAEEIAKENFNKIRLMCGL